MKVLIGALKSPAILKVPNSTGYETLITDAYNVQVACDSLQKYQDDTNIELGIINGLKLNSKIIGTMHDENSSQLFMSYSCRTLI